jgi:hypothetical protein
MSAEVQRLRGAVERTMAERTARFETLRIEAKSSGPHSLFELPEDELARASLGRQMALRVLQTAFALVFIAMLWLVSLVSRPGLWLSQRKTRRRLRRSRATVDFDAEAVAAPGTEGRRSLRVGERAFVRRSGTWVEVPAAPHGYGSPFWFFELLRCVASASKLRPEVVNGSRCRHFIASSDFALAAERRALQPPETLSPDELRHVEMEVWLDRQGRIRRVQYVHHAAETDADGATMYRTSRHQMEFFEFGIPAKLEVPVPG